MSLVFALKKPGTMMSTSIASWRFAVKLTLDHDASEGVKSVRGEGGQQKRTWVRRSISDLWNPRSRLMRLVSNLSDILFPTKGIETCANNKACKVKKRLRLSVCTCLSVCPPVFLSPLSVCLSPACLPLCLSVCLSAFLVKVNAK